MRYAMRSRADATSAEACRTFQNLAIHQSCSASGCTAWTADSDNTSRFPWPSRHRIQDPCGPNVRLANCVGLLHDPDSLSLYQAVDAHFAAGAGSDLPVGG